MPELPEVETVVRTLAPHVVGRRVVGVRHLRADMLRPGDVDLAACVAGRTVEGVRRRAKRIVFTLTGGDRFYVHLGMTGRLTIDDPAAPIAKHTHLIVDLDDDRQLRLVDPRRFGEIVWLGAADHANLGPEPLSMRPADLLRRLGRTRRAVKAALLDQAVVAGIGNIYADEALHQAKIHPTRPADSLTAIETQALNRAIKRVLRSAIRAGGSSIRDYVDADGGRGWFQTVHRVYDREGKPCRACRAVIVRIVSGGRSTHFCPRCQPSGPAAVTSGSGGRREPTSKSGPPATRRGKGPTTPTR